MNVYIKNKNVIGPISIKNVDIDKILVSNKVPFDKKDLNILLVAKMLKKLNLYLYFSQKWLHTEKTLMKLNTYLFSFLIKDDELLEKYNKICEKEIVFRGM